jgi:hypothetical protein
VAARGLRAARGYGHHHISTTPPSVAAIGDGGTLQWAIQNFIRASDYITLLHVCPPARLRSLRLGGFQLALAFRELCNGIAEVNPSINGGSWLNSKQRKKQIIFLIVKWYAGEGGDSG